MPIKWPQSKEAKSLLAEGILLLAALPFLLFPTYTVIGTAVAFLIIAVVELIPPLFRWRSLPKSEPFDIILCCWLIFIGLGIFITADPDLTLAKAGGVIIGIALWRYLSRAAKQPVHWQLALAFFGLLGAGFIGLGFLSADWLSKSGLIAIITEQLPNVKIVLPGLEDGAAHPNQVAGTLLFYFPLVWSTLVAQWQTAVSWQRWFHLALALAATAVLILTQSRSGWLAGTISIYLLILLWALALPKNHPRKKPLFWASAVLTFLGFLIFFIIGPARLAAFWQDPAQETALGSFGSLSFRQEVWQWTVTMIQDFPLTGIGLGSFRHVIRRLYPVMIDSGYPITHAHNVFLQTAVDYSLVGLILYLALIAILLTMLWQSARRSPNLRPYALGFAASLIAYHVYGLGDALESKTSLVIWIMYGLIAVIHHLSTPPNQHSADPVHVFQ